MNEYTLLNLYKAKIATNYKKQAMQNRVCQSTSQYEAEGKQRV